MKKIAFFIINNVVGGGGMIATQYAIKSLMSKGHDVIIIAEQFIDDQQKHLLDVDAPIFAVGKMSQTTSIDAMIAILKERKIDFFVTHAHYHFPIIRAFPKIKSETNIPIILNEHHYYFIPIYEKRYPLYKDRLPYLKSVDLITVIEKTSYFIWKSLGFNVAHLPNTYDPYLITQLPEKKPQVIMASRFVDFKQVELGIKIFAEAIEQNHEWKLVILGAGPSKNNINRLVSQLGLENKITMPGWVNNSFDYFLESSIHMLPSYTEPFGLVTMEAKNAQTPTIMFDLLSNSLVTDGVDGFRITCGDTLKFIDSLSLLMKDEALRKTMGCNAQNSLDKYSTNQVIQIWEECLRSASGEEPVDHDIYRKFFDIRLSDNELRALVQDYNLLLDWVYPLLLPKTEPKSQTQILASTLTSNKSQRQKLKELTMELKKIYNKYKIVAFNKIGQYLFTLLSFFMPKDYAIFWDSNKTSILKTMIDKHSNDLKLKYKVITPKELYFTPRRAYYLSRAKVFVSNTNTPYARDIKVLNKKRKKAITINIWHGCGYFKKFGIHEKNIGRINFIKRFGELDYVISSSTHIRSKYAQIFGIEQEKVIPLGVPRTDLLYDAQLVHQARDTLNKFYPKLNGKKIYLHMPTWRGEPFKTATAHYTPKINFSTIGDLLNHDEVLMVKNHPVVEKRRAKDKNCCSIPENHEKIILITHPHLDALLLTMACDVFITDYSSAFFEAMILDKPILFYAEDCFEYLSQIGIYGNFTDYTSVGKYLSEPIPEKFVETLRDLYASELSTEYQNKKEFFLNCCDGNSTYRLIQFINSL